jgi:hypothetical protein
LKLVIITPFYRSNLNSEEYASIHHLNFFLADFPIIAIKPVGLDLRLPGFEVIEFPVHYFSSVSAYSKLLLSPEFYSAFLDYEHILIYQLDCLVFSSDLHTWCEKGYDYIGAPLFDKNAYPPRLSRVGNGGLSLRRVRAFLNVLNSSHIPPWSSLLSVKFPDLNQFPLHFRWLKKIRVISDARCGVKWYTQNYSLNEDLFWSDRARLFNPDFKIAPLDNALRFAFDAHPHTCFELNKRQLPFGAHAWAKWDRAFWNEYLLK